MATRAPDAQLSLFGDWTAQASAPAQTPARVVPAALPPRDQLIAGLVPPNVRLGTSSWSFPGWRNIVYGDHYSESVLSREGLGAYAAQGLMRTVGVDRTFYAPVTADVFAGYAAQVPGDFRFLAKAFEHCLWCVFPDHARYGEHRGLVNPRFFDAAFTTDQVVAPFVEGLGDKAGVLLFQIPPQDLSTFGGPGKFNEMLFRFIEALPRGVPYAVELRDGRLLTSDHVEILEELELPRCYTVHPSMPSLERQFAVSPPDDGPSLVIRWMLHNGLTYSRAVDRYEPFDRLQDEDPSNRQTIARVVDRAAQSGKPVYVIANNKAEGCSPLTIRRLADELVALRRTRSGGT